MKYNFWNILDIRYEVKYFFQRLFKGYDNTDMWSLSNSIAKKMYKPFKAFVEMEKRGIPCIFIPDDELGNDDLELTEKHYRTYQDVLEKILFAFEFTLYDDGDLSKKDMKKFEEKYGNIHEEIPANKKFMKIDNWETEYYFNSKLQDEFWQRAQEGFDLLGKYILYIGD